jgi:hypothetical protein
MIRNKFICFVYWWSIHLKTNDENFASCATRNDAVSRHFFFWWILQSTNKKINSFLKSIVSQVYFNTETILSMFDTYVESILIWAIHVKQTNKQIMWYTLLVYPRIHQIGWYHNTYFPNVKQRICRILFNKSNPHQGAEIYIYLWLFFNAILLNEYYTTCSFKSQSQCPDLAPRLAQTWFFTTKSGRSGIKCPRFSFTTILPRPSSDIATIHPDLAPTSLRLAPI